MTIKVLMLPHISEVQGQSHGIARVCEGYAKYLPQFGVELVDPDATSYDLVAAHAGITGGVVGCAHLHGLYFTNDYNASEWEWHVNTRVIEACRNAKVITVPSAWVSEVFQRDMRLNPFIIPHGIDWIEWQHNEENEGFCLWGKNRRFDVNDNSILDVLMRRFSDVPFVSTLPTPSLDKLPFNQWPTNFKILENAGKTPPAEMKGYIQRAGVYLSLSKETFGIQCLESLSSGVPVLGWNWGGNVDLVQTGVNGYLAKPGDVDDLCEGLSYCLKYRKVLGSNARELARSWTWEKAVSMVYEVYKLALQTDDRPMVIEPELYEVA